MSERLSLIIGSGGQDGRLLSALLDERSERWVGVRRDRIESSGVEVDAAPVAIDDEDAVAALVDQVRPDRVFYLAAHHGSSEAGASDAASGIENSCRVHVTGWINFVNAIERSCPATRLVYAASSLVFGDAGPEGEPQNEQTPWQPVGVYGLTKALGWQFARARREAGGLHASVAVLFNHESRLRASRFLSRRIVDAAVRIAGGDRGELVLGDVDIRVDWGWAPDYVDAMRRIADRHPPDDYVVATGRTHSVAEFAELAFGQVGLDWREHVRVDAGRINRRGSGRAGDATRLREATGWSPKVGFDEMVERLVREAMGASSAASRHD